MTSVLVLNVDDYEAARYAKTRLLQNAGFRVLEAANGADALSMATTLHPRVVLLDVRLPDIDGRDVCRQIKTNPATSTISVIHTSSAFITPEDIASAYESGADDYITAPYEPRELISALRAFS